LEKNLQISDWVTHSIEREPRFGTGRFSLAKKPPASDFGLPEVISEFFTRRARRARTRRRETWFFAPNGLSDRCIEPNSLQYFSLVSRLATIFATNHRSSHGSPLSSHQASQHPGGAWPGRRRHSQGRPGPRERPTRSAISSRRRRTSS